MLSPTALSGRSAVRPLRLLLQQDALSVRKGEAQRRMRLPEGRTPRGVSLRNRRIDPTIERLAHLSSVWQRVLFDPQFYQGRRTTFPS